MFDLLPQPNAIPGAYPAGAEPLLAAVVADPADDTVRLAFADWLEENGDEPRAVFIRDQIALHRTHPNYHEGELGRQSFAPADGERFERQRHLLSLNLSKWLTGFPSGNTAFARQLFRRGFPTSIQATPAQWSVHGERLRRWVPLTGVSLEGQEAGFTELMGSSTLFGLSELFIRGVGNDELRALAGSRALNTIGTLHLFGRKLHGTIDVPVVRALFGSIRLQTVRELRVWFDRGGDSLGFVIAGSPYLRNLSVLDVSDAMRYEAARELFDSPNVANVTELVLRNNPIGDLAVRTLVRSKYLTRLTTLDLRDAGLTAESGRLLAGWPGLRTVTDLRLAGNQLGSHGMQALAESPHLDQLRCLLLKWNVPPEQESLVRSMPGFANVSVMDIGQGRPG